MMLMRLLKYILFFLLAIPAPVLFFQACDIIEPPYLTGVDLPNGGDADVVQRVLLEEFTGHQCPNCPEGSRVARELKDVYGDRLVIMSIHAGWFARTSEGTFAYDFQTEEGNALYDAFGVSQNPIGMINRKAIDGNRLLGTAAWGEAIHHAMGQQAAFYIGTESIYHAGQHKLDVNIQVDVLLDKDGPFYVSVFLLEDGITKPQRTNNPDYPSGVIEEYEHNHVLRTSLNGTWGEPFGDGYVAAGQQYSWQYSLNMDEEWLAENCSVVAMIYHGVHMDVMQVQEHPVQP